MSNTFAGGIYNSQEIFIRELEVFSLQLTWVCHLSYSVLKWKAYLGWVPLVFCTTFNGESYLCFNMFCLIAIHAPRTTLYIIAGGALRVILSEAKNCNEAHLKFTNQILCTFWMLLAWQQVRKSVYIRRSKREASWWGFDSKRVYLIARHGFKSNAL